MSVIRPGYWDPWDLGTDLYAWWNADDYGSSLMTDAGSGLISSWKDRKSRITLTATTTARPTYSATAFNGTKKGITFDGTANCLRGTNLSLLPTGSTPCEVWQLLDFTAPLGTATTRMSFAMGGLSGATRQLLRFSAVSVRSYTLNDGTTSSTNSLGTDLPGIYPSVVGVFFSGTTMSGRYNGIPISAGVTTVATKNTGTNRVSIGAANSNTAANFFIGPIRQTLITKPLSDADRLRMEGWLAWDGGIQSVLP